jgi:hypothetical protein
MNHPDIIREAGLGPWILPGRTYPHPLPKELEPFYCYTRDGGHSILVVLENEYQQGSSPIRFIIPAPVKAVLKASYQIRDGLVWAVLPYDREEGLQVESEDVEY